MVILGPHDTGLLYKEESPDLRKPPQKTDLVRVETTLPPAVANSTDAIQSAHFLDRGEGDKNPADLRYHKDEKFHRFKSPKKDNCPISRLANLLNCAKPVQNLDNIWM